jgi:hypothetical protein
MVFIARHPWARRGHERLVNGVFEEGDLARVPCLPARPGTPP